MISQLPGTSCQAQAMSPVGLSLRAAASILVYTLSANVTELCADRRRVRRPVLDIREGDTTIACAPVHGMQAVTTLVFDTVCAGFAVLQQQYPKNLSYKVVG